MTPKGRQTYRSVLYAYMRGERKNNSFKILGRWGKLTVGILYLLIIILIKSYGRLNTINKNKTKLHE